MKHKNKPKMHESLSNELKEEKNKKSSLERFLDVAIVVLIVLIIFLGFRIFRSSDHFETVRSKVSESFSLLKKTKVEEASTSKPVATNRKYPDYITEEEKQVLRPQSNDQTAGDSRYWSELVNKLATSSKKLTLKKYGEDCFGEPIVLKLDSSQKVERVNDNNTEITVGYGEKNWRVPAKGSLSISFDFSPLEPGQDNMLGYGCGNSNEPSGLVLIEL